MKSLASSAYRSTLSGLSQDSNLRPAGPEPTALPLSYPRGKRHHITRTLLASNRNTDSLFLLNHLEANWQELADYFHVRSRVHVEGHG